jgi:ATP-dependent helicase Lhr and Lhr-like helicase
MAVGPPSSADEPRGSTARISRYIQAFFVAIHDRNKGPLCFRLSGRAWEVRQIDWSKSVLHVRPAERERVPSWLGPPSVL